MTSEFTKRTLLSTWMFLLEFSQIVDIVVNDDVQIICFVMSRHVGRREGFRHAARCLSKKVARIKTNGRTDDRNEEEGFIHPGMLATKAFSAPCWKTEHEKQKNHIFTCPKNVRSMTGTRASKIHIFRSLVSPHAPGLLGAILYRHAYWLPDDQLTAKSMTPDVAPSISLKLSRGYA